MSSSANSASVETTVLTQWMQKVLQRFGMFAVDSDILIQRLLEAEFRGRPDQGIAVLAEIASGFDLGDIDPRARTLKVFDLPAAALLDGSTGVGQVGASRAMQLAIDKAATNGLASVCIRNSQPCGDVQSIAELAASQGCIGFCLTSSGKGIFPGGPHGMWLGHHPQAWAWPGRDGSMWGTTMSLPSPLPTEPSGAEAPLPWGLWQGAISLALTAGLTGTRLPESRKKASPYGAGAEHCCMAWNLEAWQAAGHWENWTEACLPRAVGVWEQHQMGEFPAELLLSAKTEEALQSVASLSRIPWK